MPAKKGQTFNRYSEETKKEAVRLRVKEGWAYSRIMEKFGIKSGARLSHGYVKARTERVLRITEDAGRENGYLKAQVEYLKRLNPNLHGEGSWISKPGASPDKK